MSVGIYRLYGELSLFPLKVAFFKILLTGTTLSEFTICHLTRLLESKALSMAPDMNVRILSIEDWTLLNWSICIISYLIPKLTYHLLKKQLAFASCWVHVAFHRICCFHCGPEYQERNEEKVTNNGHSINQPCVKSCVSCF